MLSINQISREVKRAAVDYPIKSVELFGSYASDSAQEKSDVDLLVEFQSENVSLFTISGFKVRMEELLGTAVDVVHAPLPTDAMIEIQKTVPLYEA